ncbi:MAG: cupin domain-containing protein [Candidatus Eisenbacteria bacterium]|uniref:Cupin domain-containing protein n=1 Tax=Eiseniibacteriota bacterium TaxID=2212470 RepID=A0A956LZ37_UNCEI|nr:cupin domain-containing protein [Candidatus Eisenbacteria bacterium]
MARHIPAPSLIEAAGNKPKRIEEFIGRVNSGTDGVSIARMESPPGWEEPAQTPEFDEYTIVLEGCVVVDHDGGSFEVKAGEAVIAPAGERVRYRTPEGARYVAICLPAFSPDNVNREPD